MSAGVIRAAKAAVELFADDSRLTKGLRRAEGKLKAFGSRVSSIGRSMVTGALAGGTALGGLVGVFESMASELVDASDRTGIAVEQLGLLKFAAEQSDASLGDLATAIKVSNKMMVAATSGNKQAAAAFDALGLSAGDVAKLNAHDRFLALAEAISRIPNEAERATMALKIFGKGAQTLLPLLKDGAAGILKMEQQAAALGLTIRSADAAMGEGFGDAVAATWSQVKRLAFATGASLVPALSSVIAYIQPLIAASIVWMDANRGLVVAIGLGVAALAALGATLVATGPLFMVAASAIGALASVLGLVATTIMFVATPLGLLTAALAAAVVYVVSLSNVAAACKPEIMNLGQVFGATFSGIIQALSSGDLEAAMAIGMAGLNAAWQTGLAAMYDGWLAIKGSILTVGTELWTGLQIIAYEAIGAVVGIIIDAGDFIDRNVQQIVDGLAGLFGGLYGAGQYAFDRLKSGFSVALNWMLRQLAGAVDAMFKLLGGLSVMLGGVFTGLTEGIHLLHQMANKALDKDITVAGPEGSIGSAFEDSFKAARDAGSNRRTNENTEERAGWESWRKNGVDAAMQQRMDVADASAADREDNPYARAAEEARDALSETLGAGLDIPELDEVEQSMGQRSAAGLNAAEKSADQSNGVVAGSFSARALSGMGANGAAEKTAKNTERSADSLERIEDQLADGGGEFE